MMLPGLTSRFILTLALLLLSSHMLACDSAKTPATHKADASSAPSPMAICASVDEFARGACCWDGQTRQADGSCSGIPSGCPEPLMVYPPEQTCDACAGAPSCAEALADCGKAGQTCLAAGSRFVSGSQGLKDDLMRATSLFLAACEAGSMLACSNAGIHFERGLGAPKDLARAQKLFEQACPKDARVAPGCNNLARLYRLQQNDQLANALLSSRCNDFDSPPECSTLINDLITKVPADQADLLAYQERLVALGERACAPVNQKGCTQLATLLRSFYPEDETKLVRARTLLEQACDQDESTACLELGKTYQKGLAGEGSDLQKAFGFFEKSCKLKQFAACGQVAMLYLRVDLTPPEGVLSTPVRQERARQLGKLSCTQGELAGCNALALLASGGDELATKALQETRTQVTMQCKAQKLPMGCALLGELEVRGLGGERDLRSGMQHLEQACKAGIIGACQRRAAFTEPRKRLEELKRKRKRLEAKEVEQAKP